ncbi:MAG TPA: TAXI family TRAP transporter solute-binding subunit [Thermodesulfobacteriota bacterium]|nr:TAXI family TRAP transporter solute-binding subunit [Thermodesulfobacteriota bacterium]
MSNKALVVLATVALSFLLLSSPALAQKIDLKLMTGPMGGSWYPLGGAIGEALQKEIPGLTISVMPGGGVANVEAVEFGKCELGFSNSSSAVDGLNGRAPFKKKTENVKQLANLYAQYFQMVVVADSPIKSVADFKGKIIATTPKGHTGTILTEQVLQVYGMSFKDISKVHFVGYSDAVALMKDGHADIYSPGTTIPASSIIDLAADRKIRLIGLPDDKIKALQQINAGYLKRTTPKGTYPGVDYDVPGVGYFAHLVVSAKLPDDLVYKITKTFAKNLPRFADVVKDMKGVTPKDLALDIGVPFHPGALKYYKEAGVL